ncbi:hypothetical protein NL676_022464 [Syzygium grande]|nr:hypothetical protein NL676_022464 [Syzygium grande]
MVVMSSSKPMRMYSSQAVLMMSPSMNGNSMTSVHVSKKTMPVRMGMMEPMPMMSSSQTIPAVISSPMMAMAVTDMSAMAMVSLTMVHVVVLLLMMIFLMMRNEEGIGAFYKDDKARGADVDEARPRDIINHGDDGGDGDVFLQGHVDDVPIHELEQHGLRSCVQKDHAHEDGDVGDEDANSLEAHTIPAVISSPMMARAVTNMRSMAMMSLTMAHVVMLVMMSLVKGLESIYKIEPGERVDLNEAKAPNFTRPAIS